MNEAVENNGEVYIAISTNVCIHPVDEVYGEVVVVVQKGELFPSVAGDDKNCVEEV